jgi:hypothetical protein
MEREMIRVLKLNSEGDPTGETEVFFPKIEPAQKWCEAQRGEKLEWNEDGRFFALEGMTKAEEEHLSETTEYPPLRYLIMGIEDDGTDRELEESDFEDFENRSQSENF